MLFRSALVGARCFVREVRAIRSSLEEVFAELTSGGAPEAEPAPGPAPEATP